jgi:hypothetical protein
LIERDGVGTIPFCILWYNKLMTQDQIDHFFTKLKKVDEETEYKQIQEAYEKIIRWFVDDDVHEANVKEISRKFMGVDPFTLSFALQAVIKDLGWEQDYIVITDDGEILGRYKEVADIPKMNDPKSMAADINVIVVRKRV